MATNLSRRILLVNVSPCFLAWRSSQRCLGNDTSRTYSICVQSFTSDYPSHRTSTFSNTRHVPLLLSQHHWHSHRHCSTDRGDRKGNPPGVQATVLHIPNPWNWLRNKWNLYRIRSQLDPSFSIDEFTIGAKQAVSMVTKLISKEKFSDLEDVASTQAIKHIKEMILPWTADQKQSLVIGTEDIHFLSPRGVQMYEKEGSKFIDIDVFCVAFKSHTEGPLLIEIFLRFQRQYTTESSANWTISGIGHFKVQEFVNVHR